MSVHADKRTRLTKESRVFLHGSTQREKMSTFTWGQIVRLNRTNTNTHTHAHTLVYNVERASHQHFTSRQHERHAHVLDVCMSETSYKKTFTVFKQLHRHLISSFKP